MRDPFFSPPLLLVKATQPISDFLNLTTLPLHSHEAILAFCSYQFIFKTIAPVVSSRLFPKTYPRLSARTRINWNVHFTSFIQSTFISLATLWVIWDDEERKNMDWKGRIWGYTGAGGMVQGFAAGYFFWDMIISATNLSVLGWGSLAHAVSALLVTSIGFRPFANYYGLNFILYELSTPFLNIHWFFDKLGMTGSRAQLYNGIILLATFGCSRLVWGSYQSVRIYQDVWTALKTPGVIQADKTGSVFQDWRGSVESTVPMWLAWAYLGSNTVLSVLNFVWFEKMIRTIRKRFQPAALNGEAEKRKAASNGGAH